MVNDAERKRSMKEGKGVPDFLKTTAEKENKKKSMKNRRYLRSELRKL
jgi:hypothetical protein